MAIFHDTVNLSEIEKFHKMGIIRGVTTNPTILLREGVSGGMEAIRKRITKNC
jgi:transaldolase